MRDLELEYLEQVSRVTGAAMALEEGVFDPASLEAVTARDDALGLLARRFASMAEQVQVREEHLRREVRELRIQRQSIWLQGRRPARHRRCRRAGASIGPIRLERLTAAIGSPMLATAMGLAVERPAGRADGS